MSAREWTRKQCVSAALEAMTKQHRTDHQVKCLDWWETVALEQLGRALLTLRHERDLLAAECRATRSWTSGKPDDSDMLWWGGAEWGHMMNARAAVDAAGVLGREER